MTELDRMLAPPLSGPAVDEARAELAELRAAAAERDRLQRQIDDDQERRQRRVDRDEAASGGRSLVEVLKAERALEIERDRLRAEVERLRAALREAEGILRVLERVHIGDLEGELPSWAMAERRPVTAGDRDAAPFSYSLVETAATQAHGLIGRIRAALAPQEEGL